MIPFSPPHIDQAIIDEVTSTLRSGWITTGPKTKLFEQRIRKYSGSKASLCLNSATAGLEIMLRWFGVKQGDEVIIPAYTYAATANVVMHCGATPVMADVDHNFNISVDQIKKAITPATKVIMPVDFGGLPCNYEAINNLVNLKEIKEKFTPLTERQKMLGRIMILADAAHSFGALYGGKRCGSFTDVSVFSFHAVKNLTTAEGGAVALNLPAPFNNEEIYKFLAMYSLHGQNKDALAKLQNASWKYDIVEAGYKCNMPDVLAAIGLAELERYEETLQKRKFICQEYTKAFSNKPWAEIPSQKEFHACEMNDAKSQGISAESSYHLYALRIKSITEAQRDEIIEEIFQRQVAVNVHFIPLPMLSYYKNLGYNIKKYPAAYDNYSREISLPVYFDLTPEQIQAVTEAVIISAEKILYKK